MKKQSLIMRVLFITMSLACLFQGHIHTITAQEITQREKQINILTSIANGLENLYQDNVYKKYITDSRVGLTKSEQNGLLSILNSKKQRKIERAQEILAGIIKEKRYTLDQEKRTPQPQETISPKNLSANPSLTSTQKKEEYSKQILYLNGLLEKATSLNTYQESFLKAIRDPNGGLSQDAQKAIIDAITTGNIQAAREILQTHITLKEENKQALTQVQEKPITVVEPKPTPAIDSKETAQPNETITTKQVVPSLPPQVETSIPWQRTTPRLAKGQRAPISRAAQTIARDLPRYKNLVLLVDDGAEKHAGALTMTLIQALYQEAAPILTSKNIVYYYLNVANDRDGQNRMYASLLQSFDPSKWEIYEQGFFYLLIPRNYVQNIKKGLTQAQQSGIDALVAEGDWTDKEITLGLNLSTGMQPLTINSRDALKSHSASSLSTKNSLWDTLQLFFIPLTAAQREKDNSSWAIFLEGHGSGGTEPYIAGFKFNEFIKYISFLSSAVKTSFLYYTTCFGGGYAFRQVQEAFQNKAAASFNSTKPNFIIVVGTLTDTTSSSLGPIIYSGATTIHKASIDFPQFFASIASYLNGTLQSMKGKDPLLSIFKYTYQDLSDTPNVWIPSSGFKRAISLENLNTISITQALARARALTNQEIALKGKQMGLLYAQEVPGSLRLDDQSCLLSMNDEHIHLINQMIVNGTLQFSAFYGGKFIQSRGGAGGSKLEPTLFLMNNWRIEHMSGQSGRLMFLVVQGSDVKACLFEQDGSYYAVNNFSGNLVDLSSDSISREEYINRINGLVATYRFRSPLLATFLPEIQQAGPLESYIKAIADSMRTKPYRDRDLDNKELRMPVSDNELKAVKPLLSMPLDQLLQGLASKRIFIVKVKNTYNPGGAAADYAHGILADKPETIQTKKALTIYIPQGGGSYLIYTITFKELQAYPAMLYLAPAQIQPSATGQQASSAPQQFFSPPAMQENQTTSSPAQAPAASLDAYIKVFEDSLRKRPYKDKDLDNPVLQKPVSNAIVKTLKSLLTMSIPELTKALAGKRIFIIKDAESGKYVYGVLAEPESLRNEQAITIYTLLSSTEVIAQPIRLQDLQDDPTLLYIAP